MSKRIIKVKGTRFRRAHTRVITITKAHVKRKKLGIITSAKLPKEQGRSIHEEDEYDKMVEQGYVSQHHANLLRNKH